MELEMEGKGVRGVQGVQGRGTTQEVPRYPREPLAFHLPQGSLTALTSPSERSGAERAERTCERTNGAKGKRKAQERKGRSIEELKD